MNKKRNIKQYIVLVTTLFLVLLQPLHSLHHAYEDLLVDNILHSHSDDPSHEEQHHEHQDDKCAICEYTFQPYIATSIVFVPIWHNDLILKKISSLESDYFFQSFFHAFLRGPPTQFLV